MAVALIFGIEKFAIRSGQLESLSKGYPTARFQVQGQTFAAQYVKKKRNLVRTVLLRSAREVR